MDDEQRSDGMTFRSEGPATGDLADRPYAVYGCSECHNVVLSMQECGDELTCHGEPMDQVTDLTMDVQPPDLREVLLDAFDLPKAGLDICLCVIGEGPLSPAEVAEKLGYDESTIRTYLNDLVDLGLLQQSRLNRESGGFVTVYHSVDLEEMREETLIGFFSWAGEAAALIEEANLTKAEYLEAGHEESLDTVFWEQFDGAKPDDG
jgi:predicted transcriptional regulator